MQAADFDVRDFEANNSAADARLLVRFFVKAKQDPERTAAEGRPIFKEAEFIQIMVAGDRNASHIRPVAPGDKLRFGKQYDHWKKTQNNEMLTGTPLEAWGVLSLAQAEEYRYFGVRTIEQMAELRDDIVLKIPGATKLKQRAREFLDISRSEAPLKAVNAELEKRDNEIATLRKAIEDQAALIKDLQRKAK